MKTKVEIKFNAKKHQYFVNGEIFPSVTTILGIIDKSGPLTWWAAKMTVAYIKDNLREEDGKLFVEDIELDIKNANKILSLAKKQHHLIKTEAGDIGKKAHAEVEKIIKTGETPTEIDFAVMDSRVSNAVRAYIQWAEEYNFIPLHSEERVCLLNHKVAGTVDCIGTLENKNTLLDLKTSNSVYPEHKLQVAAYAKAWEETYDEKIEDVRILRIGKESAEFECHTVDNIDQHFQVFLNCIPIYLWRKEESKKHKKR